MKRCFSNQANKRKILPQVAHRLERGHTVSEGRMPEKNRSSFGFCRDQVIRKRKQLFKSRDRDDHVCAICIETSELWESESKWVKKEERVHHKGFSLVG